MEPGGVVGRDGLLGGVRRLVGHGVKIVRVGGDGRGAAAAEMVGSDLAGDVVDPGGEPALVTVGVPVFENAVEHELDEILAGGAVARVPHEKAVERAVVAFKELAELVDLARAHGDHEFVVSEGVHGWWRGINHGRGRLNT